MPELPEVETTKNGLSPVACGVELAHVIVRCQQLRWPVPDNLNKKIAGQTLLDISRRGKYLLFEFKKGTLIFHLGMSGHFKICTPVTPLLKHDHIDLVMANNHVLRYNDPRRFGACLWTDESALNHPLLAKIGPEPLSRQFNSRYLKLRCQGKKTNIKSVIMDSQVVPGVGNIYASESLFVAKIHPIKPACELSDEQSARLCKAIKSILKRAIAQGGTTIKDFSGADGRPGYFEQQLSVYNRAGNPCQRCKKPIEKMVLNQRSTFFCDACQG